MKPVGTLTWLPDAETQPAFAQLNILAHSMMADRPHRQACGGQAECGTCRVRVIEGADNLTAPTVDEREFVDEFPDALADGERLACQCRPTGDVVLKIPKGTRDVRSSE